MAPRQRRTGGRPTALAGAMALAATVAACGGGDVTGPSSGGGLRGPSLSTAGGGAGGLVVDSVVATRLGVLPGAANSMAWAVNDSGTIVGDSQGRAFAWTEATGLVPLAPGLASSNAFGVNDRGWTAGWARPAGGLIEAVIWRPDGTLQSLGFQPGFVETKAFDINEQNQVAGFVLRAGEPSRAVVWENPGTFRTLDDFGDGAQAFGLNEQGEAVGIAATPAGIHAVRWSATGAIRRLPVGPAASSSSADAINDAGYVVGTVFDQDFDQRAVLWTPDDRRIELGTLPGHDESTAADINNDNWVVGTSRSSFTDQRAFLWTPDDSTLRALTSLPSAARGVNDDSVVVGDVVLPDGNGIATRWRVVEEARELEVEVEPDSAELHPRVRRVPVSDTAAQRAREPGTVPLTVRLTRGDQPVEDSLVTLRARVLPAPGGHQHLPDTVPLEEVPDAALLEEGPDRGLPVAGHFVHDGRETRQVKARTDAEGRLQAEFVAGYLGSVVELVATARSESDDPVADTSRVRIRVPGLLNLQQQPDLNRAAYWIGGTDDHPQGSNWHVQAELVESLRRIARTMQTTVDGESVFLQYNDASLPLGGTFTLFRTAERPWETPFPPPGGGHLTHAEGLDLDVSACYTTARGNDGPDQPRRVVFNSVSRPCVTGFGSGRSRPELVVRQTEIRETAGDNGAATFLHEGDHFHLRFEGGTR